MQTLFLSIIRVMWGAVFGWMGARWGIEVDNATKQEVINWTVTAGFTAAAVFSVAWEHYLYPLFKEWFKKLIARCKA